MIEIGDEGHLQGVAMSPSSLYGLFAENPSLRPDWFTPAFETFYADIENLQITYDAGTCSSRVVFNYPSAHTAGVEFEVNAQPTDSYNFV